MHHNYNEEHGGRQKQSKETKRKTPGWSTKMLEDIVSRQKCEDSEDVRQRININQDGLNELGKGLLCSKLEGRSPEKCKVVEW